MAAEESVKQRGHDKLCKFLIIKQDNVHKYPDNMYQIFIITFLFVNGNLSSQEAVNKGKKTGDHAAIICSREQYLQRLI